MKLYLSSYKLGNETETLKKWLAPTKREWIYSECIRFLEPDRFKVNTEFDMNQLNDLGFEVEILDLRDYFERIEVLRTKLLELDMLWVSGGNTFILRQAMRLSGFDELIADLQKRPNFVYGGYSAGCCVLSPTLQGLQIVDEPYVYPYELKETIWEGLGLIDYAFLPHFDSDHPESEAINKEVEYCKKIIFLSGL